MVLQVLQYITLTYAASSIFRHSVHCLMLLSSNVIKQRSWPLEIGNVYAITLGYRQVVLNYSGTAFCVSFTLAPVSLWLKVHPLRLLHFGQISSFQSPSLVPCFSHRLDYGVPWASVLERDRIVVSVCNLCFQYSNRSTYKPEDIKVCAKILSIQMIYNLFRWTVDLVAKFGGWPSVWNWGSRGKNIARGLLSCLELTTLGYFQDLHAFVKAAGVFIVWQLKYFPTDSDFKGLDFAISFEFCF